MDLKVARVVITGASKGLGKCLAEEFASRGVRLVLGDIDEADLKDVADKTKGVAVRCDVTKLEDVAALAETADKELGAIDIWINNAGIWIPYVPVEELDFARAKKLIDVNYFGVAHGTVEALRHMRPHGKGLILSILSVRALQGKPLAAAYCASKFAAEGFSQAVRGEAHKDGVRVVGVYPYRMKTELFGDNKHEDYANSMEPQDVARIIIDHIEADDPADHLEIWSENDLRKKVHAVV